MANSIIASMGIVARRSRLVKCSRSRLSSSAVRRRVRFLGLAIRRNSRPVLRACCTISGTTGSSLTLFAARRTTPIQIRSLSTVAGPAPSARRDCTCRMRSADVRVSTSILPRECLSRKFEVSLLAPLPARNSLESVDVPADQFCEGRRSVPLPSQRSRFFERDFAMLRPAQGCRAMREGSALLMQHRGAASKANNRRVARRTVCLSACFDGRHDDFRGDKRFLSPLCPPSNQ